MSISLDRFKPITGRRGPIEAEELQLYRRHTVSTASDAVDNDDGAIAHFYKNGIHPLANALPMTAFNMNFC